MSTKKTIEQRLKTLREEYQVGQQKLTELDLQRNSVRDTLLRISGAIQALEEIIEADAEKADGKAPELASVEVAQAQ